MDIRLPDGTVLQGVPEGTTQEEILGRLQLAKHPAAEMLIKEMAAKQTADESSFLQKFNAGMGLGFTNIGRGMKQLVGGDYDRSNAATDRALNETGAGFSGNVAGTVASLAPLALVPGANTVAGAGAIGATTAALQPSETTEQRLENMAWGGLLGAGSQAALTHGAKFIGEGASRREMAEQLRKQQNAVRDQTLREGQKAGYVVPPSAVNPSWLNRRLESVGGKAAMGQEAALRNQPVTNAIAREEATLMPQQALSEGNLKHARIEAAGPYRKVAQMNENTARWLEQWKEANLESKLYWNHYNRTGDPASYKTATASDQTASNALYKIEQYAQRRGSPELVKELREARVQIAKIHDIEKSLNVGTGDIDASVLGRALDKGAPLSGGLKTVGQFQQAFPQYMREASKIPTPGVSKSEALSSALLATGGAAAAGSPAGLLAGGLPLISGPARSLALSGPYQRMMTQPQYGVGPMTSEMAMLADPEARRALATTLRMGLPSTQVRK